MQHPGPVPGERAATAGAGGLRQAGGLRRLDDQPFDVLGPVAGGAARVASTLTSPSIRAPDDPPVSR